MKYIIMCGGEYSAWESPRQLTKIYDETLVKRTIRLLKENGINKNDIFVSASDKRFFAAGLPIIVHNNTFKVTDHGIEGWWVDGFYPTNEPVCYILGDVFFSPKAIFKIVKADENDIGIRFFASSRFDNPYFIKKWPEPFAFKVWNFSKFKASIEATKDLALRGGFTRHPISWELWHVISGRDPLIAYDNYDAIDDYSCDIDNPTDIEPLTHAVDQYVTDHLDMPTMMPGA